MKWINIIDYAPPKDENVLFAVAPKKEKPSKWKRKNKTKNLVFHLQEGRYFPLVPYMRDGNSYYEHACPPHIIFYGIPANGDMDHFYRALWSHKEMEEAIIYWIFLPTDDLPS